MKYELVVVGALETNCYLVYCEETRACAVIDPGADHEKIIATIADLELKPVIVLNTHGHVDHIGANSDIVQKYGVPLAMHRRRHRHAPGLRLHRAQSASRGQELSRRRTACSPTAMRSPSAGRHSGSSTFPVTRPAASASSTAASSSPAIRSSNDGVGRTDLPGGSWKDLDRSIRERILTLPEETIVLPGHGPWTTVGQERSAPIPS